MVTKNIMWCGAAFVAIVTIALNVSCNNTTYVLPSLQKNGDLVPNDAVRRQMAAIPKSAIHQIQMGHLGDNFDWHGEPLIVREPPLVTELEAVLRTAEEYYVFQRETDDELWLLDKRGAQVGAIGVNIGTSTGQFGPRWKLAVRNVRVALAVDMRNYLIHKPFPPGSFAVIQPYRGFTHTGIGPMSGLPKPRTVRREQRTKPKTVRLQSPKDMTALYTFLTSADPGLFAFDEAVHKGVRIDIIAHGFQQTVYVNLAREPRPSGYRWKPFPQHGASVQSLVQKWEKLFAH